MHYAPLEYWKGDRVVYKKGEHLAEVEEVVRVVKEDPIPFAQRRKPVRRRNQTRNGRGSTDHDDLLDDGTGCDEDTLIEGIVAKFPRHLYVEGDEESEDRRSMSTLFIISSPGKECADPGDDADHLFSHCYALPSSCASTRPPRIRISKSLW